jgi:hypothetical protein
MKRTVEIEGGSKALVSEIESFFVGNDGKTIFLRLVGQVGHVRVTEDLQPVELSNLLEHRPRKEEK